MQTEQERNVYYAISDIEDVEALNRLLFSCRKSGDDPEELVTALIEKEMCVKADPYESPDMARFRGIGDGAITDEQAADIRAQLLYANAIVSASKRGIDNLRYLADHPRLLTRLVELHDAVIAKNCAVRDELMALDSTYKEQQETRRRLEGARSGDDISDIIEALARDARSINAGKRGDSK